MSRPFIHRSTDETSFVKEMELKRIIGVESDADPSHFRRAVGIWRANPHVANRRLLASVEILSTEVSSGSLPELLHRIESLDVSRCLCSDETHDVDKRTLLTMLDIGERDCTASNDDDKRLHVYVTKQMPRVPRLFSAGLEFSLFDREENRVVNIHKPFSSIKRSLGPERAYTIEQGRNGYTSISVYRRSGEIPADPSIEWLERKLFPRVIKWMTNTRAPNIPAAAAAAGMGTGTAAVSSLSLVPSERYARLYCELKEKYGAKLIENWPENTDPKKFVYEDIAIATYLLLLWETERSERSITELQSYLDLGCGNGLLVHILFSEGHRGVGIDLRRRKIWDSYPAGTPLQVDTIVPSSATLYPGVDWIIGNHSDELTPWIPIIAARSSNSCRFFLLPCCPFELDGRKYQRHCATKSQYSEYIDYVRRLCDECGFKTRIDKLRIPSTKRICLIGWERMDEQQEARENRIRRLIGTRAALKGRRTVESAEKPEEWSCDFKPRDTVEKVRNCTQLEKTLIADIVEHVAKQLLRDGRGISLDHRPAGTLWNAGRRLELRRVAESIPKETMARLRRESGGLQTLLRNHSNVFRVVDGKVQFRIPGAEGVGETFRKRKPRATPPRIKIKPCWFHHNHPDGCPATETSCNYKH